MAKWRKAQENERKIAKLTKENVRLREEASARCTNVTKKKLLKNSSAVRGLLCCARQGRRHVRVEEFSECVSSSHRILDFLDQC